MGVILPYSPLPTGESVGRFPLGQIGFICAGQVPPGDMGHTLVKPYMQLTGSQSLGSGGRVMGIGVSPVGRVMGIGVSPVGFVVGIGPIVGLGVGGGVGLGVGASVGVSPIGLVVRMGPIVGLGVGSVGTGPIVGFDVGSGFILDLQDLIVVFPFLTLILIVKSSTSTLLAFPVHDFGEHFPVLFLHPPFSSLIRSKVHLHFFFPTLIDTVYFALSKISNS